VKAIDLFCPLVDGDVVGFAARPGLGQMVLIQELLYRRATRPGHLTLITPLSVVPPGSAPGVASGIGDPGDDYGIGDVQTVHVPIQDLASPPAGFLDPVDATITLSLSLAKLGMWPAVDPHASSSRHLDPSLIGAEHVDTIAQVRELLRRFPPEQESADGPT